MPAGLPSLPIGFPIDANTFCRNINVEHHGRHKRQQTLGAFPITNP
jgi:hypothetical protein